MIYELNLLFQYKLKQEPNNCACEQYINKSGGVITENANDPGDKKDDGENV